MLKRLLPLLVVLFTLGRVSAVPIASNFATTLSPVVATIGQSFTVVTSGPVNNIVVNFFADNAATTPSAFGTAFLLSSAYTGNAAALNALTTGYLGQANASGGFYTFDSALTLLPGVQYFVYTNSPGLTSGSNANPYAGGTVWVDIGEGYSASPGSDAAFVVDGTLIATGTPELAARGSVTALSIATLWLACNRRRRT